ncbi:uncharacterized protein DC041_0012935 [Schistosoma bovis]|uniref:Uncharacterized protein n=1 Tax=Schistosoma bovis TaxID=6184 RepID=A0A430QGI6_SCHBO|nr:uncharacterized protein DC041_0012935 [Schistosoma bovis]
MFFVLFSILFMFAFTCSDFLFIPTTSYLHFYPTIHLLKLMLYSLYSLC